MQEREEGAPIENWIKLDKPPIGWVKILNQLTEGLEPLDRIEFLKRSMLEELLENIQEQGLLGRSLTLVEKENLTNWRLKEIGEEKPKPTRKRTSGIAIAGISDDKLYLLGALPEPDAYKDYKGYIFINDSKKPKVYFVNQSGELKEITLSENSEKSIAKQLSAYQRMELKDELSLLYELKQYLPERHKLSKLVLMATQVFPSLISPRIKSHGTSLINQEPETGKGLVTFSLVWQARLRDRNSSIENLYAIYFNEKEEKKETPLTIGPWLENLMKKSEPPEGVFELSDWKYLQGLYNYVSLIFLKDDNEVDEKKCLFDRVKFFHKPPSRFPLNNKTIGIYKPKNARPGKLEAAMVSNLTMITTEVDEAPFKRYIDESILKGSIVVEDKPDLVAEIAKQCGNFIAKRNEAEKRSSYEAKIIDGKFYIKPNHPHIDKMKISSSDIVIDEEGRKWCLLISCDKVLSHNLIFSLARDKGEEKLHVGENIGGLFHHTSFWGNEPILSAGTLRVENGIITRYSNESGHYKPNKTTANQMINFLHKHKAITDDLTITIKTTTVSRPTSEAQSSVTSDFKFEANDIILKGKNEKGENEIKKYIDDNKPITITSPFSPGVEAKVFKWGAKAKARVQDREQMIEQHEEPCEVDEIDPDTLRRTFLSEKKEDKGEVSSPFSASISEGSDLERVRGSLVSPISPASSISPVSSAPTSSPGSPVSSVSEVSPTFPVSPASSAPVSPAPFSPVSSPAASASLDSPASSTPISPTPASSASVFPGSPTSRAPFLSLFQRVPTAKALLDRQVKMQNILNIRGYGKDTQREQDDFKLLKELNRLINDDQKSSEDIRIFIRNSEEYGACKGETKEIIDKVIETLSERRDHKLKPS